MGCPYIVTTDRFREKSAAAKKSNVASLKTSFGARGIRSFVARTAPPLVARNNHRTFEVSTPSRDSTVQRRPTFVGPRRDAHVPAARLNRAHQIVRPGPLALYLLEIKHRRRLGRRRPRDGFGSSPRLDHVLGATFAAFSRRSTRFGPDPAPLTAPPSHIPTRTRGLHDQRPNPDIAPSSRHRSPAWPPCPRDPSASGRLTPWRASPVPRFAPVAP